jgi:hypothetical protein
LGISGAFGQFKDICSFKLFQWNYYLDYLQWYFCSFCKDNWQVPLCLNVLPVLFSVSNQLKNYPACFDIPLFVQAFHELQKVLDFIIQLPPNTYARVMQDNWIFSLQSGKSSSACFISLCLMGCLCYPCSRSFGNESVFPKVNRGMCSRRIRETREHMFSC